MKTNWGNLVFWLSLLGASAGAFVGGFYYTYGATANVPTKTPGEDVGSRRIATPAPTTAPEEPAVAEATPTPAPDPLAVPDEAPQKVVRLDPLVTPTPQAPRATPTPPPDPAPEVVTPVRKAEIFRVQVGPFDDRETADRQVRELQTAGINAVVVYDAGRYQAQIGAFSDKARAISVADEVNVRGFSVTIRH